VVLRDLERLHVLPEGEVVALVVHDLGGGEDHCGVAEGEGGEGVRRVLGGEERQDGRLI
jgi:hypothetical protein